MHTKQILAIFSMFTSIALAAPAGEVGDVSSRDVGDLEKRSANFDMFGGDRCTGGVHGYFHADRTGYRCYPVPANKRSIRVLGRYLPMFRYIYAHTQTHPSSLIKNMVDTYGELICLVQFSAAACKLGAAQTAVAGLPSSPNAMAA